MTQPVVAGRAESVNQFSSSFTLTPAQQSADVRADAQAIAPVIEEYMGQDHDTLTEVKVTGKSSPDAGPTQDMIQLNDNDRSLAAQRAKDGTTALGEPFEVNANGRSYTIKLSLPSSAVTTSAEDVILTQGQHGTAAQLQAIATRYGMTSNELVAAYDMPGHPGIRPDDAKTMDQWKEVLNSTLLSNLQRLLHQNKITKVAQFLLR